MMFVVKHFHNKNNYITFENLGRISHYLKSYFIPTQY